jgi:hypothetical protein
MSSVGNPRRNARKRIPPATRRRALELLAASPHGATEAILVAHGLSIDLFGRVGSRVISGSQSISWITPAK